MFENNQMTQAQFQENIQRNSGLIIATGFLLLIMGMFAMGSPLVAGLSLAMMVGTTLIISGIGQLSFAFKAGKGIFSFVVVQVHAASKMVSNQI